MSVVIPFLQFLQYTPMQMHHKIHILPAKKFLKKTKFLTDDHCENNLVFFRNEEFFVQLDELDELDRITRA